MKYFAKYKCLNCGTIVYSEGFTELNSQQEAVELVQKLNAYTMFEATPFLADEIPQKEIIHCCHGGSVGVALFCGFCIDKKGDIPVNE